MAAASKKRFLQLHALFRNGELEAADKALSAALLATPKEPNLLHLAAQVAEAQGELPRAAQLFRRAIAAHPDWMEAEYNLARVLASQNKYAEAIALMMKVSYAHPDLPPIWEALAKFQQQAGDLASALAHWQKALALAPERHDWRAQYVLLLRQMCDWRKEDFDIEKLPPQAVIVLSDDPATQMQSAIRYSKQRFGSLKPTLVFPAKGKTARIRLGYLSSDFRAHATAFLMAELFGLHDRTKFDVFAYSYGVDDHSAIRERIKEQAGHFVELNKLSAAQAAARIREDNIDILIDLKGHTRGARLDILAHRPAPLQVHWLGYPGTLGTDFIDFFIGDRIAIPDGQTSFFTEKIIRLPHCYQINDRQRTIGQPKPRAAYGLPENTLVLASFNQTYKITPEIFALWCEILLALPEAVLWLYQSNTVAPDNLRHFAAEHGIDPARLIFAVPLPHSEHLARYAHVDLAIDTFPVGGHTTTSDALWAGAPVVTMVGQSFVSRVASSILAAAELPQLVAATPENYKKLILELARNKTAQDDLRRHLKDKRLSFPLFDTPRFVRDLETALIEKWKERV